MEIKNMQQETRLYNPSTDWKENLKVINITEEFLKYGDFSSQEEMIERIDEFLPQYKGCLIDDCRARGMRIINVVQPND